MRVFVFFAALLLAPVAQAQTLDDPIWLAGCWRTEAPRAAESGSVVTEVWVRPPIPAMLGYSYTVGEGQTQGWEQTQIEMIDGWPHFVAMPNGGAPLRFRTIELLVVDRPPPTALFENREHDCPQRVLYVRDGTRLTATISRADGSDQVVFHYRRVRCERALRP